MLAKHTIEEEDTIVRYTYKAECVCDKCHKRFFRETEPFQSDIYNEIEEEFLKSDFSLCYSCRKIIEDIKQKQISFVRKEVLCQ